MSPNSALTDHGGLLARLSGVARVACGVAAVALALHSGMAGAAERFTQQVALDKGLVAVVAEGDFVVMQSAGSGGFLSADAFAVEPRAVRRLARVRDLAPTEDPATHLQRQLGDPRSAAQQFLQAYQPLAAGGVPKPPQVTPLARHLHPTLRQALQTASQRQAAGIQELNTCR